jgi:hypothetical protein
MENNTTLPQPPIEYLIVSDEPVLEKVRATLNKKHYDFSLGSNPEDPRQDFCFLTRKIDPATLSEIREQDVYIQQRV